MATKKKKLSPEEILQNARQVLQSWTKSESLPENNRLDVNIDAVDIKKCVQALIDEKWGYLSAITALDRAEFEAVEGSAEKKLVKGKGNLEVLYHFCSGPVIATLRVPLEYKNAAIDTICDIIPSATLYEREAGELLGIDFKSTPSTEHLLLPDSWPEGVYPLRKSFTGLTEQQKAKGR
jgi:NADH:ubiquinone oxidoreductase subunit C